jgi:TRAP-type C4-dicarboxylate transport system permease small subunit
MRSLLTVERFITRLETGLLVLFLSVMIVLAFAQVILRNFFDAGLLWGDTLVRHLVLWVGFAGAAIATSEERHISIDALGNFLPPRAKNVVRVLTNLFAIVVCCLLASAAYKFLLVEKEEGATVLLDIPSWVALAAIPPGYLLMAFHFTLRVVHNMADLKQKAMEAPRP